MKLENIFKEILIISLLITTLSCSYRPILDQNDRYLQSNKEENDQNIERCTNEADDYLKQYKARRAAKEAARKGAIGAIFGGIFGFVVGGDSKALLKGLAVGAGVGAVAGGLSVAGEGKLSPDQIKQNYVTNCLAKQGYSVIGWE
ncbi:MAG: hypothetical protein KGQ36_01790 [Rickettsiales bacterium]|nr:hypothetical protein [Rickettsiales bacterium]